MIARSLGSQLGVFHRPSAHLSLSGTRAAGCCSLLPSSQQREFRNWSGLPRVDASFWQRVLKPVAGVSAAGYTLVKLQGLKFAVPLLKMSKLGPVLSMAVSMGAYTAIYGWQFAGGMIGLLLVHELGHAAAMRHYGIPVGPITFLPFLGAVVEMRGRPVSAYEEAMIALAGPFVGTLATFPFLFASLASGSAFAAALAHWGCMVNLLNLLPVGSLDGGRIAGALSRHFLVAGLAGCGGLILVFPTNPLLYLVFLSGGYTVYSRYWGVAASDEYFRRYYALSDGQRLAIGGAYAGLVAFIAATMAANDRVRKSPQQLRAEMGTQGEESSWERDWGEESTTWS